MGEPIVVSRPEDCTIVPRVGKGAAKTGGKGLLLSKNPRGLASSKDEVLGVKVLIGR